VRTREWEKRAHESEEKRGTRKREAVESIVQRKRAGTDGGLRRARGRRESRRRRGTKNGFENTYAAAVVEAGRSWQALIRHLMLEGGVPGAPRPAGRLSLSVALRGPAVLPGSTFISLSFLSSPGTRRLSHHRQKDRYCFWDRRSGR